MKKVSDRNSLELILLNYHKKAVFTNIEEKRGKFKS